MSGRASWSIAKILHNLWIQNFRNTKILRNVILETLLLHDFVNLNGESDTKLFTIS
jgi:hypothetical protein